MLTCLPAAATSTPPGSGPTPSPSKRPPAPGRRSSTSWSAMRSTALRAVRRSSGSGLRRCVVMRVIEWFFLLGVICGSLKCSPRSGRFVGRRRRSIRLLAIHRARGDSLCARPPIVSFLPFLLDLTDEHKLTNIFNFPAIPLALQPARGVCGSGEVPSDWGCVGGA